MINMISDFTRKWLPLKDDTRRNGHNVFLRLLLYAPTRSCTIHPETKLSRTSLRFFVLLCISSNKFGTWYIFYSASGTFSAALELFPSVTKVATLFCMNFNICFATYIIGCCISFPEWSVRDRIFLISFPWCNVFSSANKIQSSNLLHDVVWELFSKFHSRTHALSTTNSIMHWGLGVWHFFFSNNDIQ